MFKFEIITGAPPINQQTRLKLFEVQGPDVLFLMTDLPSGERVIFDPPLPREITEKKFGPISNDGNSVLFLFDRITATNTVAGFTMPVVNSTQLVFGSLSARNEYSSVIGTAIHEVRPGESAIKAHAVSEGLVAFIEKIASTKVERLVVGQPNNLITVLETGDLVDGKAVATISAILPTDELLVGSFLVVNITFKDGTRALYQGTRASVPQTPPASPSPSPAPAPAPVPPAISVSPTSLSFTATQGGANPANQALTISNTGGGTLVWTGSDDSNWLTLSRASGTGNGTATAKVTTGSLAAGNYSGKITVSATGATPVTVPVTFTVTATCECGDRCKRVANNLKDYFRYDPAGKARGQGGDAIDPRVSKFLTPRVGFYLMLVSAYKPYNPILAREMARKLANTRISPEQAFDTSNDSDVMQWLQDSVKIWGEGGREVKKYIEKLKEILKEILMAILPNPVGNIPSPRKVFKDQAEKLASENTNIKQLIDAALSPQSKDAASMDANVFKAMQQLACDAVSSQEMK